ncbi:hypothetical protein PInf_013648 [Phytophthora infestans]|nr:hypothetical protein PInf_013648 [Phytophthora infestans]
MWISDGDLHRGDGYVRLDSKKYQDWQVLAYEGCRYQRWAMIMEECERVEVCLASGVTAGDSAEASVARTHELLSPVWVTHREMGPVPSVQLKADVGFESREESVATLDETYISNARNDFCEHPANNIGLEDYAKELTFLPDLTEEINTTIDYNASNVAEPQLSTDRRERLVVTLKNHEHILIASGNVLPPPAYGVVCDIDTQGHAPIKQRARRVPLRFLGKPYELLRALLQAGLINGLDIRFCIDYMVVSAITAIMEYAMPLVDDLLTDLECYL